MNRLISINMKIMLSLATIMFHFYGFAGISREPQEQEFSFKYDYKSKDFTIKIKDTTYEKAFDKAASSCYRHYRNQYNGKITEDIGLDIIDECANPS